MSVADDEAGSGAGGDSSTGAASSPLWSRLREAQDAALSGPRGRVADRALARAVSERLAALPRGRDGRLFTSARRWTMVAGLAVLVLGAAGVALRPTRLRFETGAGLTGAVGHPLEAEADSELPLKFSDGSTITFQPGAAGTVERLSGTGAEVQLRRGRLEAQVVHAPQTRWVVRAGPFRVRVTGTRFQVDWSPTRAAFAVTLREGSVIVDGAVLGAGVPLRAGQRLQVDLRRGSIRTEPVEASAPGPVVIATPPNDAGPGRPSVSPTAATVERTGPLAPGIRSKARTVDRRAPSDWRALADAGAYAEAWRVASRVGIDDLERGLDPAGLLALGDVARYGGAPQTARRIFERLVARFPSDARAADAVFSLGRLGFEARRPDVASRWFDRYIADWPDGPLADQAGGRRMESALAGGDRARAVAAARDYLRRAPKGAYAPRARDLLEPAGGAP